MSEPTTPAHRYDAALAAHIEQRWQSYWTNNGTFHADNPQGDLAGDNAAKDSYFVLDMFPYPSGKGLHVGHPFGYIATDVTGRFQRMRGKNVLHALGYDAFGLPAEQYAVQTGQHPRITTNSAIETMQRQLGRLGLGHDERRSFATIDPDYVKWTQWIFLQIFGSYFDDEATNPNGGCGAARPISELRDAFASGKRTVPGGRTWHTLTEDEQEDIIDGHRLAYISNSPVNWCPGLGTVLANEEVTAEGRSERGNYPVFTRNLRQWTMRITAYSDRLIDDLDHIEWPDKVRTMQRNWIGRSHGADVDFAVNPATDQDDDGPTQLATDSLRVFTTRPDTLFGATFMVVAPEHPLLQDLSALPARWPANTAPEWTDGASTPGEGISAYQQRAAQATDADRQDEARTKTGVFTGLTATNPTSGVRIPIFVADYVLMGYGTGAIMSVPAHDERDYEFATRFALPIIPTVRAPEGHDGAWQGDGEIINSANESVSINGLHPDEAKTVMIDWLETSGLGQARTTYRLRDWLFSRQRYWGEPFPIVFDQSGRAKALPESMLPVDLPDVPDYSPRTYDQNDADSTPEPPLGRVRDWVEVDLDLGDGMQRYERETNTMPNWAGSSWYVMRYLDPNNDQAAVGHANEQYWMGPREDKPLGGADLYVGGVEHAVLHLLYARFWHKVLFDLGHVSSPEPFHRLFNQGYILAYAYTNSRGSYVPAEEVEETVGPDGQTQWVWQGQAVTREYGKMGKSLKNSVAPDDVFDEYGADTFRMYEMSMGPLDISRPWETRAVVGAQRFLQRVWRNIIDESTGAVRVVDANMDDETARQLARAIDGVTSDMAGLRYNTAIAKMIVLNNHLTTIDDVPRAAAEPLLLMIAPFAPHIAEELWSRLGHTESLAHHAYPVADERFLVDEAVTCVIQVKGKVRDRIEVAPDISDHDLTAKALAADGIQSYLDGEPRRIIVRAPGLVNIVP